MRRIALRVDAVFLTVAGVFGLVSDLQSYVFGTGPFGLDGVPQTATKRDRTRILLDGAADAAGNYSSYVTYD